MAGIYTYGRDEQVYVAEQSTFGTLVWPAAGDAIRHVKCSIKPNVARKPRTDLRGTRSRGETIEGKRDCKWSLSGFLIPSGVLGTPPDIWPLLKHAFGVQTINGGASVVYTLVKEGETVLNGLSIHRFSNHLHQAVRDAIVSELTIKSSGVGEAEFEISGEGTEEIFTGTSDLAVDASNGASSVQVTAGDGAKFSVGSKVDIGTSAGHTITGIAGDVLSISPNLVGAQATGSDVIPNKPSTTTAGNPVSGIKGSYTIDAVAVKMNSSSVKLVTNFKLVNTEFGTAVATRFISPGKREVTFETEHFLTKDDFKYYGHARKLVQEAVFFTIGNAAAARAVLAMPKVELDVPELEIPENDEAMLKVTGYALPTTGTAEDELSLTFN